MKNNLGSILIFFAVLAIAGFALYVMLFRQPATVLAPSTSSIQDLQDLNNTDLNGMDNDLKQLDSESASI